ncbi:transcriptional regulator, LacI family [Rhizobium sp. RU20A]|uniref:LacI family DNA-binding transcriptional regulator n=1 Tax=Rhizobium sp. RU20A TaxID=1907412 RepID=UPI0009567D7D|nr:LacI family DNA-binding transcriptional regulator [Rhizobium sp. RU20A]SIQ99915.1 transcriptional regulator, LacI family [Rhizobium sp. RU20A]
MRPTVHDIAERAGVSLATVDRVLNGRPNVRGVTRARVEAAIADLGYVRDVAAANLAKGRVYSFAFILPAGDNPFMRTLEAEVRGIERQVSADRIRVGISVVPPFDAGRLADAIDAAVAAGVSGIAAVAVEDDAVVAAIDRAKAAGIAFVTLVSDIAQSARDHFAGVDNMAAGRTAGSLMARFLGDRPGPVAVLAGSMRLRDHRERLEGFAARLGAGRVLLPVLEGQDDPARAQALVGDILKRTPDLAGLYSLGAGNAGLVRALAEAGGEALVVIAHELTPETRAGLSSGLIAAVLNQDAGHEVRSAVRVLKARADGVPLHAAQERIRIDIFVNDNLPPEAGQSGADVSSVPE